MTFTRVHDGVAFATYDKFTSADANALRTNDELFWSAHTRNLSTQRFDAATIISASPTSGTLGGMFWSDFWGAYVALALPRGSTGPAYYALATPGGRTEYALIATPPSGVSTTDARPSLITVKFRDADDSIAAMLYADSSSGTAVAESTDMAAWSRVYYGGSALAATLTRLPSLTLASGDVATPVMNVASRPAFVLTYGAAGHIACSIVSGGTASGAPYAVAQSTARNLVMCLASSSLHACVYDDTAKSFTTYATPMHVDTVGTASNQKIAYDPILERFVLVTPGNSASALSSGWLYYTTNDGRSAWSATVGWKRVYLGFQNLLGSPFILQDFMITSDGAWVLLVKDNRPVSLGLNLVRVLLSFDQGGTWREFGSWPRVSGVGTPRLSQSGPGFVIHEQSSSPGVDWLSVSGASPTPTVRTSEAL